MKLYVVRHGRTEYNEKRIFCGRTDIPLCDKGREQLGKLAEDSLTYGLDLIIASPLTRAVETAEAAARACGLSVITDERLVERAFGDYEATTVETDADHECRYNFAYKYPNGESYLQVAVRVYNFLDEIKEKYPDKNIMIVAHGGVCRMIRTYFRDMTDSEFYTFSHPNCSVIEYEI